MPIKTPLSPLSPFDDLVHLDAHSMATKAWHLGRPLAQRGAALGRLGHRAGREGREARRCDGDAVDDDKFRAAVPRHRQGPGRWPATGWKGCTLTVTSQR